MKFYKVAPIMQVTDATEKGSWFSFLHRYIGSNNVNTQYKMAKSNVTGLRFSKVEYQYVLSETRTAMDEISWLVNPNQTMDKLAIFRVQPDSIKISPWLQSSSF